MRKATLYFLGFAAVLLLVASCASIGHPSGGPRDEDPPRFLTSTPLQGAVEVTPSKAVLTFDELVNVKDAFSKVVVSPPPTTTPRVSSLGRRVTVEFRDSLLPNTTYTVDFGDAIVDNNEGNKLENFIYTFSTGPTLDSLMISGMVLGAEDLLPTEGILVGLHSNPADSAFRKTRFERIAKTDENGRFVIGGLPAGRYRIYALEDRDGDMAWSSPEETLAFYDAIIEPTTEQTVANDTIRNLKTGEIDTIVNRGRTRFLPNDILLRSYNTGFRQQYISKYERQDSTKLNFIFNNVADSLPQTDVILPGGTTFPVDEIAVTERSLRNDTITYWLKAPEVIASDTLRVAVRYLKADSAYNMVPVFDTLRMLTQRPVVKLSKAKAENKKGSQAVVDTLPPPVPTLAITAVNPKPEVNQKLYFTVPQPLESFNTAMISLEAKQDTLWLPVKDFTGATFSVDSLNPRRFSIDYPWEYETSYRLTLDSLAGKGIYGLMTDDLKMEFTTRAESDYGTIKFNLSEMGADTIPRFVDLLDGSGNPLRSEKLIDNEVTFNFLLPGKYNVRVVEDGNGDGLWTPGNFELGIQPDVSYYYKETIDLKANWDQEIDWKVFATPVDRQLPEALRKKKKNSGR